MKKITIIADGDTAGEVLITLTGNTLVLPVGVEITVDDTVYAAVTAVHSCVVGYFVADSTEAAALPTTGIADGSYCVIMNPLTVKFLSGGAWV